VLSTAGTARDRADFCPGVLTPRHAEDGLLVRVRLPGGFLSAPALAELSALSNEHGDGRIELTSRANIQLRGLSSTGLADIERRLTEVGLLPSATHERVRNIVASPLAGLDATPPLSHLVREFDGQLCADPRLSELSGRFLFALEDGRGDVTGLGADVTAVVTRTSCTVEGLRVPRAEVAATMVRAAHAFLDERVEQASSAWRVRELDDGRARVRRRIGAPPAAPASSSTARPSSTRRPTDAIRQPDGRFAVAVIAPLGRLTAAQLAWLGSQTAGRAARVTPWRTVVVPDLTDAASTVRAAEQLGLGVGAHSPWLNVSACAGRPGCAKALADVQADAARAHRALGPDSGRRVHWSGCERRCGRPVDTEVDIIATTVGYERIDRANA
jgi:precorrin-3B synthase